MLPACEDQSVLELKCC